ncbi:MAG: winged helix-turn-helix domain-containing protein [Dehalococcoidia bacterium]|nr:winged helix-turn-helix domain-containing protein [Dehalococcoidia bacterium]
MKKSDTEDAGKVFAISKTSTFIGRRTLQYIPDIELSSEVVSRRHVEIVQKGNEFFLRDLGSTNGTMLDDDRILPGKLYELKHNSKIGLGVEGDTAYITLQFKESEGTNIIDPRKSAVSRPKIEWLKIDEAKKEAVVDSKQARLSKKEYELILFLYRNAGNICSRDDIIKAVWPESKDPGAISDATIDQLIHRLREKVEPEPSQPVRIVSKKSFGYKLV